MTVKFANRDLPATKVDLQRRKLLKLSAAAGASTIASPWISNRRARRRAP